MTDHRSPLSDPALDALFAQARATAPADLPDALSARLIAQAEAMVPAAGPFTATAPARRGWFTALRDLLSDLGGAPGLAGLSVAGVAGVWIGFVQPEAAAGVPGLFWEGAAGVSPAVAILLDDATPFDDFDLVP
jgi:hypothetical protein